MPDSSYPPGTHPSPEDLDRFARGEIDDLLALAIEAHLDACASCPQALEMAQAQDRWLDLIRDVGPAAMAAQSPAAAGSTTPSGYELEALIGRGGMGVVYRARQLGLDRRVALKMIASGLDASPRLTERFRREVEATASLNHPAIVPIHDVGVRDGVPFYAMELLEGGSLADRLAAGPMPIPEAVALVDRLARAVDYAHRQGIIHRDLKPSNILMDSGGAAKVADFGLAKRLDADPMAATHSRAVLGTPAYMAPEQASGRPETVGVAADIYALGAILFECLTGRPPFLGPGPLEILELIRTTPPPSPSRFRESLPVDLETICLTCLEKAPGQRYDSAASLADDLGRFLRGEPIRARPSGPLKRLAKWARRRPIEAAFAGLLILSMLGTIAGLLVHQARLGEALRRQAEAADDARRQRNLAESNYRDARDAIAGMLAALTRPDFAGNPRLAELHRAQAEVALTFYDRVLGQAESSSPIVRRDTARAAVEAANLQITLGRNEPAEANLLRALRLYDGLLAAQPEDRDLLRDKMVAEIKLGLLLLSDRADRAIPPLERALDLARRRAGDPKPGDDRLELDLAWCEHNLGTAWQLAGRRDRALAHYEAAVSLYRARLVSIPAETSLRAELAESLVNLALIRAIDGQAAAAETGYAEAEALLDAALAARPGAREYLASRADLLVNRGNLDVAAGRVQDGIARYGRGLRDILPLLEAEPNVQRLKATAVNLSGARALALEKAGRFREAADDWARVVALEPPGPTAVGHTIFRLLCLARGGDHAAVAGESTPLEGRADLPAIDRYNLACALALASNAAPPATPARATLRARSLRAVARALEGDPQLRKTARQDPDLQSLADDPGFRKSLEGP